MLESRLQGLIQNILGNIPFDPTLQTLTIPELQQMYSAEMVIGDGQLIKLEKRLRYRRITLLFVRHMRMAGCEGLDNDVKKLEREYEKLKGNREKFHKLLGSIQNNLGNRPGYETAIIQMWIFIRTFYGFLSCNSAELKNIICLFLTEPLPRLFSLIHEQEIYHLCQYLGQSIKSIVQKIIQNHRMEDVYSLVIYKIHVSHKRATRELVDV